jgi:hypothetical protein
MSDLSTFAGQAEHYAGVRARLGSPTRLPYRLPDLRVRPYKPQNIARPTPPPYGAPINLVCLSGARNIIQLVALRRGVLADDITGPRRDRATVAIRYEAIRLVHSHCSHLSMPDIGRAFGGRDHSSILYALGRIKRSPHVKTCGEVVPVIINNAQAGGL